MPNEGPTAWDRIMGREPEPEPEPEPAPEPERKTWEEMAPPEPISRTAHNLWVVLAILFILALMVYLSAKDTSSPPPTHTVEEDRITAAVVGHWESWKETFVSGDNVAVCGSVVLQRGGEDLPPYKGHMVCQVGLKGSLPSQKVVCTEWKGLHHGCEVTPLLTPGPADD